MAGEREIELNKLREECRNCIRHDSRTTVFSNCKGKTGNMGNCLMVMDIDQYVAKVKEIQNKKK